MFAEIFIQFITFLAVPWVCLQFVRVVFPDHTHLLFLFIKFTSVAKKKNRASCYFVQ